MKINKFYFFQVEPAPPIIHFIAILFFSFFLCFFLFPFSSHFCNCVVATVDFFRLLFILVIRISFLFYILANSNPRAEIDLYRTQGGIWYLDVWCNENGFEEKHVRALCDVDRSTKPKEQTTFDFSKLSEQSSASTLFSWILRIGKKGIGFKSVFAVADIVQVFSNGFKFELNSQEHGNLGFIYPDWVEKSIGDQSKNAEELGGTLIRMRLRDEEKAELCFQTASKFDSTSILCIQQLRKLQFNLKNPCSDLQSFKSSCGALHVQKCFEQHFAGDEKIFRNNGANFSISKIKGDKEKTGISDGDGDIASFRKCVLIEKNENVNAVPPKERKFFVVRRQIKVTGEKVRVFVSFFFRILIIYFF